MSKSNTTAGRAMDVGAAVRRATTHESRGVFAATLVEILNGAEDTRHRGMFLEWFLIGYKDADQERRS